MALHFMHLFQRNSGEHFVKTVASAATGDAALFSWTILFN
jgi:hypothetical protein